MSFLSLLSSVTKDKKIQEKAKHAQLGNHPPNPSTSLQDTLAKNTPLQTPNRPSIARQVGRKPSKPQPSFTPSNVYDDPAVQRLKEARRVERERLAQKNQGKRQTSTRTRAPSSPNGSVTSAGNSRHRSKSTTPTATTTVEKRNNRKDLDLSLPEVSKSRFKFKPSIHGGRAASPTQKTSTGGTAGSGPNGKPSKMSFKELMDKASHIEKPKVALPPIITHRKQEKPRPSKAYQSLKKSRSQQLAVDNARLKPTSSTTRPLSNERLTSKSVSPVRDIREPSFAKPSPELLRKLKNKKKNMQLKQRPYRTSTSSSNSSRRKKDAYDIDAEEEEDDDFGYYDDQYDSQDDGFIVDDEEEEEEYRMTQRERKFSDLRSQGYSRDEIWEIFSRGKKRGYYQDDYDSADDMEATGNEILEDEERTLKQAKLDDLREQRLLEEHARRKNKLLHK